jgi:LmbE family N-acetylglucosaminyl deacetylase
MNKILILSPHPDDGILGAGGTISRFIEEGKEVWYLIFSWQNQGFSMEEIENSLLTLGIRRKNIIILDYPVRRFNEKRQEILQEMVSFRSKIAPELIFCHSSDDTHQDHKVVREEAFRAFKWSSIWGYDLPWNTRNFKADKFVSLYHRNIEKKIKALKVIESQQNRRYYNPKRREANAIAVGEKISEDFAEAFEIISEVI